MSVLVQFRNRWTCSNLICNRSGFHYDSPSRHCPCCGNPGSDAPVNRAVGYLREGEQVRYRTWRPHAGIPAEAECWASRHGNILRLEFDEGTVELNGDQWCLVGIERYSSIVEEEDRRVFRILDHITANGKDHE